MPRPLGARTGRTLGTALVVALVFAAGSAVAAFAAEPPTTIHACVNNSGGTIEVALPAGACGGEP